MTRASSDESLAHNQDEPGSTPGPATKFELFDRLYCTDPQIRADVDAIDAMIRLTP